MNDIEKIQEELNSVYEQIGSTPSPDNLDELLDKATELENILNPKQKPIPKSFGEWELEYGSKARTKYNLYREEYGDSMMCFESEYVEQMYREYLEEFERNWYLYN